MGAKMLHRLSLGAVLLAAAALLLAGSWYCYTSTLDTATVGLMSINILQGERPLFFYGQPYFGALEAYLAAGYVSLFGFSEFVISLSPISFTLGWILFTYLLFARIHSRTAGLVAATCAAFPGYYIFWYSVATYGGYSAILCIGTSVLWLSLRVFQDQATRISLLLHSLAIGILTALGIWIHALILPYLFVSACILGLYVIRQRFHPVTILCLALAGCIALTGFLPVYFETGSIFGSMSEPVDFSKKYIFEALYYLFAVNSYELISWNFIHTFASQPLRFLLIYTPYLVLLTATLLAFFSFFTMPKRSPGKAFFLIPFVFCLLFMLMYIQHHLAIVKAPRYAIPFLTMLLSMIWSLAVAGGEKKYPRVASFFLLGMWILYQITGTVLFIAGNGPSARLEQQEIRAVVNAAREQNLKSVVTYGDYVFGLKSQKFSMFAENKIAFSHADAERYQQNAQVAETDRNRGYLTDEKYRISLINTLQELGVAFKAQKIGKYYLFSNLRPKPQYVMRAVPGREMKPLPGPGKESAAALMSLFDRNQDDSPGLDELAGKTVYFDTGKVRDLCGVWMFTSQNPYATEWERPWHFEMYVSENGDRYRKVFSSLPYTGNGFHAGPMVYIGGPWGKVEGMFSPVPGRYIKIILPVRESTPVTELFVFETDGTVRQESPGDIDEIIRFINREDIDFVYADRWVSARLRQSLAGSDKKDISLPRFSTRYRNRPLRYFIRPENGRTVICDTSVADECEYTLIREYGQSILSQRLDLRNYSLFSLSAPEGSIDLQKRSALIWNGHFPMQTNDMNLLARWFNSYGLPVWRPDFTKTTGIYRDSWTNGKGRIYGLDYTLRAGKDKELVLYTNGWRPGSDMATLKLSIFANGNTPLEFGERNGDAYIFLLPESLDRLESIEIRSTTFVPSGRDARKLGIDIKDIEIQ